MKRKDLGFQVIKNSLVSMVYAKIFQRYEG